LDQHPPFKRKERHMSAPESYVGGVDVPMISFSFILDGTRLTMFDIGCKFAMRAPRPGGMMVEPPVCVVKPDTTELVEVVILDDDELVPDVLMEARLGSTVVV
jgi:hypothetical protein